MTAAVEGSLIDNAQRLFVPMACAAGGWLGSVAIAGHGHRLAAAELAVLAVGVWLWLLWRAAERCAAGAGVGRAKKLWTAFLGSVIAAALFMLVEAPWVFGMSWSAGRAFSRVLPARLGLIGAVGGLWLSLAAMMALGGAVLLRLARAGSREQTSLAK